MIPIDEKHMIRLAADGDMAAFEQLVTTHQPAIYRLALRMTGNPEDAADMTQEAFLRAWRGLGSFQADSSLSTWLFRLTSNVCIDFLRAARRHLVVPISGLDADGEEYTLDAPDPAKLPEEELLAREEREELRAAMDLLAPEQRLILSLRVENDLSYTDIAAVLGVREGTVKSRLARARDQLRKKLSQSGNKAAAASSNPQKGGRRKYRSARQCANRPSLTGDSCAQRAANQLPGKPVGLSRQFFNMQRPSRSSSWQACRRWRRCRRGAAAQTGCSGSSYRPPPSCGSRRPRRRTTSCG